MKLLWGMIACCGLGWTGAAAAAESYALGSPMTLPSGQWGGSVAVGDVTGDQRDDIVAVTDQGSDPANDGVAFIYVQRADGSLDAPRKIPLGYPHSAPIVLVNLDRDAAQEIVIALPDAAIKLLDWTGAAFATADVSVPGGCSQLVAMDIDRDTHPDLVCTGYPQSTFLFGDGAGGFRSRQAAPANFGGGWDLKAADVSGDGIPDLVGISDKIHVLVHDGVGAFRAEQTYELPASAWSPVALTLGDYNADGRTDIAVITDGNVPIAALWLYLQGGTGAFQSPIGQPSDDIPRALASADLDGDGRKDLVVSHVGWHSVGVYLQGTPGMEPEALFGDEDLQGDARALAVGDVDGDRCPDVVTIDPNYALEVRKGSHCRTPVHHDFDSDGSADLLWRNTVSGANVAWGSAESMLPMPIATIARQAWQVAGAGDFDGDRFDDVLWHNAGTGENVVWPGASEYRRYSLAYFPDKAWGLAGIGDFNGDGADDLLWRNVVTGANVAWQFGDFRRAQPVTTVADPHWVVQGTDDFDGDGRDDIFWRNNATGANVIWRAADSRTKQPVTGVTNLGWRVVGTGDFNGDRKADLLWRLPSTGKNVIWLSGNPATQVATAAIAGDWSVAQVDDFDGDGRSDIVWRNAASGANRLWPAGKASLGRVLTTVDDPAWKIAR